jgi:outer membrane protein TolC
MPIDLPTALRLAESSNPLIAVARARVAQALARLDQASVLWLPNLLAGTTYYRHDGQTQNQRGEVFGVSRSNLFAGGGPSIRFETSDAYFQPLVARRLTDAAAANARAVSNDIQLDAAIGYLDVVEIYGRIAINLDTLSRAEEMLRSARAGDRAGLNRTTADVNRAATEVQLRREEQLVLRGRAAAASARLARLLLLKPTVDLQPADPVVLPLELVPAGKHLDDLVALGLANRPEVRQFRATLSAAEVRVQQARLRPLMPRMQLDYPVGIFGGGMNNFVGDFSARSDLTASAYWELENWGLGYAARVRERRADAEAANFQLVDVEAMVAAQVSEAAKVAAARFAALTPARRAVEEALEMYRKLKESSFGMAGPRPQFDALEPLLAIQALNNARVQYLAEVIDFNRAEFRLYTALGNPPLCAEPAVHELPLPAVPESRKR